ncbi:MAG: DNA mismatch repair protein MutL, partial [Pirellulales bacterium]
AGQMRRELVDWAKGQFSELAGEEPADAPLAQARFDDRWQAPRAPLALSTLDRSWAPAGRSRDDAPSPDASTPERRIDRPDAPERPPNALQLHDRYLVTESDDGMVVIDQHALHERILYEQLREKVLSGALESQALLVPEPVDLSPAEAAMALESRDVLSELGVAIEPFGGDTVLVSSFPAMLANFRPDEVLLDLVDQLLSGGKQPDRRDQVDSLLHMISCKAAIKAGDRLTPPEIAALLQQRHLARDTHHCPHGRPTALYFSREELDRQFKRT